MRVLSLSPTPFWDFEDKKGMPSIYLGQKGFVDAGHEVLYAFAGEKNHTYDYEGINIYEFKLRFPEVNPKHIWLLRFSMKLYWFVFVIIASVKGLRLCKDFRPDVVYGHSLYAAPVAWIIGKFWNIPNITRMYGTFLFPWIHSIWGKMAKFEDVLAFKIPCKYLIVTNDGTKGDECAALLGVPKCRLKFWRNGVDKEVYNPILDTDAFKDALSIPRNNKVILAVSRLVKWKGVDRLISALPKVLELYPTVTAVVVGDGEERDNLERLCVTLGIRQHIRFVGLIHHDEVPRFLNAADLFVSLYHISNVGNPLLEALCCGKCIVTLDNGDTGKVVQNGRNGILLDETSLEGLPKVLADLLKNDKERERLGQAAREYALNHLQSWPERIQMEIKLIQKLVEVAK